MTCVLSAEQMRMVESDAIGRGVATGMQLMERAGRGCAEIITSFPEWDDGRLNAAVVLCGPGNNGGDGFVVARHLVEAGVRTEVFACRRSSARAPDAAVMRKKWESCGKTAGLQSFASRRPSDKVVVVDSLFGTGLTRKLEGEFAAAMVAAGRYRQVVAVDIFSGVNADDGRLQVAGEVSCPTALHTVTFESSKLGHFLGNGGWYCGELHVVPIGLADSLGRLKGLMNPVELTDFVPEEALAIFDKSGAGHKYTHGHLLVIAGGSGKGGAARLAAWSGLRIGAGLVTLACPGEAFIENASQLNAVMLTRFDSAEELGDILCDRRINAVCVGPGLGVSEHARRLVLEVLGSKRPAVIDADAMTAFVSCRERLFEALHSRAVLTPHDGEFCRIFPEFCSLAKTGQRIAAVENAASRAGTVLLLKGPVTVIAEPKGRTRMVATVGRNAAPWLATAGSGDTLAGVIGGLLARQMDPLEAAACGAWIHAETARYSGPGTIADDLPRALSDRLGSWHARLRRRECPKAPTGNEGTCES